MIKITPADKWFSLCVRKRAAWCCERCGTGYGKPCQALHCSHYHGRGKYATRFDPRNATSLCYGCHMRLTAHPMEHHEFFQQALDEYQRAALWERSQDTSYAKGIKRAIKEVAKHYKSEYETMTEGGEFTGY